MKYFLFCLNIIISSQFEIEVMKKKNREQSETEHEDDMFAFGDLTTLGENYIIIIYFLYT